MPAELPAPLPRALLPNLAVERGLMLCLDYDGTLAEISPDPATAIPYPGVREKLQLLASRNSRVAIAIVTGRTLGDVKRLLGIERGLFFSGVHGLELDEPGGNSRFAPEALVAAAELSAARRWLTDNVPAKRGFRVEDKRVALGLHFRLADEQDAASLCERFERFIAHETPQLKLMRLKMLLEAVPRAASKARAVLNLKRQMPSAYATAYFGDDSTDEDAFAALATEDVGVLVGAPRDSLARFQVDSPAAVLCELQKLASTILY